MSVAPAASNRLPAAISRREWLVGGALLGTAAVTGLLAHRLDLRSPRAARPLDELVPERVGSWVERPSHGLLIPRGEQGDEPTYDDVQTRFYVSPAAPPVALLIAYGNAQTGTTQLHRPEVCYPAAGFRIRRQGETEVELGSGRSVAARRMTASAPGRHEQIVYWSRVADEFPVNATDQRLAMLRATLGGAIPDGALVRFSMFDAEPQVAWRGLEAFARLLVASAGPELRRILVGSR